jgi:hypothetical protein
MSHNAAKNTGPEMLNRGTGLTHIVRSSTLHIVDQVESASGLKVRPCPDLRSDAMQALDVRGGLRADTKTVKN